MERVIRKAESFLENSGFDWAVCGGAAVDFLLRKRTRSHEDLDLCVFWEDRHEVIRYMLHRNWRVVEALGMGMARELFETSDEPRNLYCFLPASTACQLIPMENGDYRFEWSTTDQTDFDYVDFLFNKREDGYFCYAKNHAITRSLDKAILEIEGIRVLAPEIVLLNKAIYWPLIGTPRAHAEERVRKHRHDFDVVLPLLTCEQRSWLKSALEIEYKDGHEWLETLVGPR